jgi:hypothetical protein
MDANGVVVIAGSVPLAYTQKDGLIIIWVGEHAAHAPVNATRNYIARGCSRWAMADDPESIVPRADFVHDRHCCMSRGCHHVCSHLCGSDHALTGCCDEVQR